VGGLHGREHGHAWEAQVMFSMHGREGWGTRTLNVDEAGGVAEGWGRTLKVDEAGDVAEGWGTRTLKVDEAGGVAEG